MKLVGLVIVIWLVVGAVAANQRHYFHGSAAKCTKDGTIAVTIVAGPLNYAGANPKVHCKVHGNVSAH